MNINELEQLKTLTIKLTNYIKELSLKEQSLPIDSMDAMNNYNEFLKNSNINKIEEIDIEINNYFDAYTEFLKNKQII